MEEKQEQRRANEEEGGGEKNGGRGEQKADVLIVKKVEWSERGKST